MIQGPAIDYLNTCVLNSNDNKGLDSVGIPEKTDPSPLKANIELK